METAAARGQREQFVLVKPRPNGRTCSEISCDRSIRAGDVVVDWDRLGEILAG